MSSLTTARPSPSIHWRRSAQHALTRSSEGRESTPSVMWAACGSTSVPLRSGQWRRMPSCALATKACSGLKVFRGSARKCVGLVDARAAPFAAAFAAMICGPRRTGREGAVTSTPLRSVLHDERVLDLELLAGLRHLLVVALQGLDRDEVLDLLQLAPH
mmetsp:Transcript_29294/g.62051  ORF Transcript_29294/g.62051 Transcript_29294/m.62051 type:complete len:159 (+) Transcript_29294:5433-5909(+)